MKKSIICGSENVKEFRGMLKETVPEFFDLVKVLYQNGLIEGLRGCKLETGVLVSKVILEKDDRRFMVNLNKNKDRQC